MVKCRFVLRCVIVILFFSQFTAYAQEGTLNIRNVRVMSDEPHFGVNSMIKDSLGYLWIGTASGLLRYNGYNTVVYKKEGVTAKDALYNKIWCIVMGPDKNLWLGTFVGLLCFDLSTESFVQAPIAKSDVFENEIHKMHFDAEGNLWFANHENFGVFRKNANEKYEITTWRDFENVNRDEFIPIRYIAEDKYGDIWIAKSKGISKLSVNTRGKVVYDTNSGINDLLKQLAILEISVKIRF